MLREEGKSKYKWSAFLLLNSIAFFFIYPADIILSGNQYIYFFWGMKNAGVGYLANDPLASEADPFPLFSYIVEFTERYVGQELYYVLFWLVCLVYVVSLFNLAKHLFGKWTMTFWGLFSTLFLFLHATPIWSFFFRHVFDVDLRWLWDNGVANQGLLMGYFQPSSMGVLLLWSLERYLKGKVIFASLLAAIAGAFHANYILIGGMMIATYLLLEAKKNNWKPAIIPAVLSLVIVTPYIIYIYHNFTTVGMGAEELSAFKEALEAVRIDNPHLDPGAWLNWQTVVKIALLGIAGTLLKETKLYLPYAILLGITILISVIALVSNNLFLINLAPWRLSVVLVPIATTVLVFYTVNWLVEKGRKWLIAMSIIMLVPTVLTITYRIFGDFFRLDKSLFLYVSYALFLLGVLFFFKKQAKLQMRLLSIAVIGALMGLGLFTTILEERAIWDEQCGEIIQPNITDADKKSSLYLIPPQETYIRLRFGVPVYVDNNLYFSRDLADWKARKDFADHFYILPSEEKFAMLSELKERGITHIVWRGEDAEDRPELEYVTDRLYRIK